MTRMRSRDGLVKNLEKYRDKGRQKYGVEAVSLGNQKFDQNVVPSASWMLDYKLGIGGFPYGHAVEVFGANGLGKSSVMGYLTCAHVQQQGRVPAIIAAEPAFDYAWAERFGLDPELVLIQRPDDAEQAFEMIYDLVYDNLVDYILLDSLGALAAKSEADGGGKKAYGISGTVTSGLNAIMPKLWKNNIGLMILNQVRHAKTQYQGSGTLYDSPGGEGLHHNCVIRLQLKPGRTQYKIPMGAGKDREAEVTVGRELVCTFTKNKLAMNPKAARFDFFHIATDKHGFGIDEVGDIKRTCQAAGVITGTTWLEHHSFPKGKVNGEAALGKLLAAQPDIKDVLRQELMSQMLTEQMELREKADAAERAALEVVPDDEETAA